MAEDVKRALRGAWPGPAIEPDATLRAWLITRPIRYGHIGDETTAGGTTPSTAGTPIGLLLALTKAS